MRILMLDNSFTSANEMPTMLAELTGAEVVQHTRGGAHLAAETIAEVIRADQVREKEVVSTEIEVNPNLNRNDIRLRVLYMYNLLLQYTDADHQLTTNEIRAIMERDHGITMHRTTVPGDIEMLKAAGFDVHARRSRQNRYYIDKSQFGMDVKVKKAGEEHFQIRVKACLSPTFYSWVFQ